ncbi:SusC/RagA family TonB-linked outer membrane protein [Spirosoma soli]|uniref:SusC/RagA family TonB-linked outer membrane protein n=1 Tax=Spirosoma soli TaxID=1770529 RepID=A0ABW5M1E9_9BACT
MKKHRQSAKRIRAMAGITLIPLALSVPPSLCAAPLPENGFIFSARPGNVLAAEVTVSGTVKDEAGAALPGVNVLLKGTSRGATTDAKGQFSITVPDAKSTLIFSFVGYQSQEVVVGSSSQITITLVADNKTLNEVVVVGYGTQKVKDLTGSVGIVKVDDARKTASYDIAKQLQGQVAGVTVQSSGEPGGFVQIKIRGISSFGNNGPLFVIDGVPVNDPFDFSPDDVESIQVLKDASAGAIYGSRAATGVVIITTKKGKAGPLKVDYNGYAGSNKIYRSIPVLDRVGYQTVVRAAETNAGLSLAPGNDPANPAFISNVNTDWQKVGLKTGYIQDHNLNFSGGTEALRGSVGLGYFDQSSTVTGPQNYTRYSLNTNLVGKKGIFNFGAKIAYTNSEKIGAESTRDHAVFGGAVTNLLTAIPTMPVYDPNRLGGFGGSDNITQRAITLNVVGMNSLLRGAEKRNRLLTNVWGEAEILKNLKYRLNLSYDNTNSNYQYFEPKYDLGFYYLQAIAIYNQNVTQNSIGLAENTLTYLHEFGKHKLDFLAGYTYQKGVFEGVYGSLRGLTEPYIKTLGAGIEESGSRTVTGTQFNSTLISTLARVNYNFADKYLLTVNFRRDGSSRFSPDYRFGNFGSVAAAWNIHNDIKLPEIFTTLKLRGGYGTLGNQNIGDYLFDSYINTNAGYVFNNVLVPGATRTQVVDPNIKWESKRTTNVAIDMGLLQDRLSFTAEYFDNRAYDMLAPVPIPYSVGATNATITTNAASVRNYGIEFTGAYRKRSGDFQYEISGNVHTLTNRVLELGGNNNPIYGAASKTEVGHSVGEIFGYRTEGIFQTAEEVKNHATQPNAAPGDIKFVDTNGDKQISATDRVYLGSAIPKVYFGANFNASYRNFDLSFFVQGNAGNKVYNGIYRDLMNLQYGNASVDALNFWTPTNTNTNVPRPIIGDPNTNNRDSDRFVESGSYARLQNAQIGYTLPASALAKIKGISRLRAYVSGQNVFLITKYRGLDPDFNSDGLFSRGFDWGSYPNPRSILIGLQIGL